MAMPTLSGVDHCHLNVTNLAQAVTWYKTVLGFNIVPELAFWDEGTGPLTLEDPAATIRLVKGLHLAHLESSLSLGLSIWLT
jgi:catechol 2,3-dioxygenase